MDEKKKKILKNTLLWGFILWLFGYAMGMILFAFVPADILGWVILPFGVLVTLWVLFKKVTREEFGCYVGLGIIWTVMAVVLDYIFLVKLLSVTNYYKLDVFVYYALMFVLPVLVGWYKFRKIQK